jgi:glutamate carboxypeptidase
MHPVPSDIQTWLTSRLPQFVNELRQLCAIDSPTGNQAGINAVGNWISRWATERGWAIRTFPDALAGQGVAITMTGSGSLHVLLAAHLDTVHPFGTAAAIPLQSRAERLIGPGSADNKGGLLAGLYAAAAIAELHPEAVGTLTIACGPDEETDSRVSHTMLQSLAPQHDLALVLEPARTDGSIVSARKGNALFTIEVHGQAAHAGVDPERGASAVAALAHQIIALQALNGSRTGLTVNVGEIGGGYAPNVIPDHAWARVDVRVADPADMQPVEAAIRTIAVVPNIPGTSTSVSGGWGFPPLARTPEVAALAGLARTCATELGFSLTDVATGGISYANLLAGLGLPVLDGLGPIGGNLHTTDEYIEPASIVPRTALLALIIIRAAEHWPLNPQP